MATKTKTKSTSTDPAHRAGRPKGAKNVFNTQVQEAIVEAASRLGRDGKGEDGLVGYLMSIDPTRQFIVYMTL